MNLGVEGRGDCGDGAVVVVVVVVVLGEREEGWLIVAYLVVVGVEDGERR